MRVQKSEFVIARLLAKLNSQETDAFKIKKDPEHELHHSFLSFKGLWIACAKKLLGKGAIGKVKKCTDEEGNIYAIKIEEKNEARSNRVWQILDELGYLKVGFFIRNKAYTVMTYFKGKSLFHYMNSKKLSEEKVLRLALKAAWGVSALHEKKIIHRDIKGSNFIVCDDETETVALVDFDGALRIGETTLELISTKNYASPELEPSFKTDIYALGQVFQELQNAYQIDFSPLITQMRAQDPKHRPSLDEVIVKLQAMQDKHNAKIKFKLFLLLGALPIFALGFPNLAALYLLGGILNIAVNVCRTYIKAKAFTEIAQADPTPDEQIAFRTGYCVSCANHYSKALLTWFDRKNYSKAYYAGERWHELNPQDPKMVRP